MTQRLWKVLKWNLLYFSVIECFCDTITRVYENLDSSARTNQTHDHS